MTKRKMIINGLQNTTQKTKDWATRTALNIRGELGCSGRVGSSCSTSITRHVPLVIHQVIREEGGKDPIVITTNGKHPWIDHLDLLYSSNSPTQQSASLYSYYLYLCTERGSTKYSLIWFGLIGPWIECTIYNIRSDNASNFTTEVVS